MLVVLIVALVVFAGFWTEMKWFEQVDAVRVFWTQYGWSIALGVIGFIIVAAVVAINLRIALGSRKTKGENIAIVNSPAEKQANALRSRPWLTYGLIPAIVGLLFGASMSGNWRSILLLFNATSFGETDPEYGLDVSFYVFALPVLHILVSFLFTLLLLSFVTAAVVYWMTGHIETSENKFEVSKKAQRHAAILLAIGALVVAANYWLSRYDLLLSNNDRFAGASYTDINASKPGLTILSITVALIAVLFIYAAVRGKWRPAIVGIASAVAVALVVSWLYPTLVQSFRVTPNAAELESEYIQRNINATLKAYDMNEIDTTNYEATTDVAPGQLREDSETTAQIRLLDPNIVDPSFNQLEQYRQYYRFEEPLVVDRYTVDGELRDTVIGVRELNLDGLDNERRSWVNDHTVYTHGYGVAAAYGNTVTTKGDPAFWESEIPSSGGMGDYEPRIYFGQNSPDYSIVGAPEGTTPWELDYPTDTNGEASDPSGQVNTTYTGDGGPSVGNLFEKLMFSIKFQSSEMFFSDRVTSESQILYDRDPHERVSKVAPYLTLDSKAVPAVVDMDGDPDTPKRVVWIVDAYTTSNNYPYSARQTLEEATSDSLTQGGMLGPAPEQVNYIRNSVKAVVDAYDGSVTLYQWDEEDPIINAWKGIFPGQITPVSEMSGDLMAHVRYPEDLFKVQRELLSRYHVTNAQSFYSGGDFWQVPPEPTAGNSATTATTAGTPSQPPYYMTLKMPGQDTASFSITTSYIPGGNTNRNILNGFLAADGNAGNEAGTVADSYGQLRLLDLPRGTTIPGPGQAQNIMLTNPDVSRDLNLLDQRGTQVIQGNLLSLPVGGGMLYVQPVYVQASTGTQYPTLQYVLTLFGDQVGFAPTLDESLDQVFAGDSGVKAGDAGIAGQKEAIVDGGEVNPDVAPSGDAPTDAPSDTPSATDSPSATPSESPSATSAAPPAAGTPQERLDTSLQEAQQAMTDSQTALDAGDWAAYGEAQDALQKAIEDAVAARQELDGN